MNLSTWLVAEAGTVVCVDQGGEALLELLELFLFIMRKLCRFRIVRNLCQSSIVRILLSELTLSPPQWPENTNLKISITGSGYTHGQ